VRETAARIRDLLAAVDVETRRRAVEALAGLRDSAERRIVVSYLVPEEHAWVDECCDGPIPNDSALRRMLLLSLYRPEQIARIGEGVRLGWNGWNLQLLATLANRLGPDVGSLLEDAFDGAYGSDGHRDVANWAAELPTDDAFRLLLKKGGDR
ncbi:MolR family transcriptional regulator, partial [Streptomyces sp. TRM76130]|nr:MolR family transcriptional regulator [Streptomyces sp. TRM76130]